MYRHACEDSAYKRLEEGLQSPSTGAISSFEQPHMGAEKLVHILCQRIKNCWAISLAPGNTFKLKMAPLENSLAAPSDVKDNSRCIPAILQAAVYIRQMETYVHAVLVCYRQWQCYPWERNPNWFKKCFHRLAMQYLSAIKEHYKKQTAEVTHTAGSMRLQTGGW